MTDKTLEETAQEHIRDLHEIYAKVETWEDIGDILTGCLQKIFIASITKEESYAIQRAIALALPLATAMAQGTSSDPFVIAHRAMERVEITTREALKQVAEQK